MKSARVFGSTMTYREAGEQNDAAVLFLHGNPTSSFIWRNVIPSVALVARCIAPDLIGFGGSGKPAIEYSFADHVRYLDRFIEAQLPERFFMVAQDWGTALAFHFAARHPHRVLGLAFMEFIRPLPTWHNFHQTEQARATFKKFRTPGEGEKMVLEMNAFVERVLPSAIVRTLTDEEMDAYRVPFPTYESRRPIWRLANELPIGGHPQNVWEMMEVAHVALAASTYPKLLFAASPGALVSLEYAEQFVSGLSHCRLVHLGDGRHYLQEDHAQAIGEQVAEWIGENHKPGTSASGACHTSST